MLDPYAPVGRMIEGLLPAHTGGVIPHFPTIAEVIAGQVVARIVAGQADAVRNGAAVERAGIRVTRESVGAVPRPTIERIAVRPGRMQVFLVGGEKHTHEDCANGSGDLHAAPRPMVASGMDRHGWPAQPASAGIL